MVIEETGGETVASDGGESCCVFTLAYGTDLYLAMRTLWTYRHQNPDLTIHLYCLEAPAQRLCALAREHAIQVTRISVSSLAMSDYADRYLTAVTGRFLDLPRHLARYRLCLMVDVDTLCLAPLPLAALAAKMEREGALVALAREVPAAGRAFAERTNQILDALALQQYRLDLDAPLLNAGVVAIRPTPGALDTMLAVGACLRRFAWADGGRLKVPGADQVALNVAAQTNPGVFYELEGRWNVRESYGPHPWAHGWPERGAVGNALIWHARDTLSRLFRDVYPEAVGRFRAVTLLEAVFRKRDGARNRFRRWTRRIARGLGLAVVREDG